MQHVYSMCILASALDCNGNYGDDSSSHNNIVVNSNNLINLYFIILCSEWEILIPARAEPLNQQKQGHN